MFAGALIGFISLFVIPLFFCAPQSSVPLRCLISGLVIAVTVAGALKLPAMWTDIDGSARVSGGLWVPSAIQGPFVAVAWFTSVFFWKKARCKTALGWLSVSGFLLSAAFCLSFAETQITHPTVDVEALVHSYFQKLLGTSSEAAPIAFESSGLFRVPILHLLIHFLEQAGVYVFCMSMAFIHHTSPARRKGYKAVIRFTGEVPRNTKRRASLSSLAHIPEEEEEDGFEETAVVRICGVISGVLKRIPRAMKFCLPVCLLEAVDSDELEIYCEEHQRQLEECEERASDESRKSSPTVESAWSSDEPYAEMGSIEGEYFEKTRRRQLPDDYAKQMGG